MNSHKHLIVRLPSPLEQQRLIAEIAYHWVAVLSLLISIVLTLLALTG